MDSKPLLPLDLQRLILIDAAGGRPSRIDRRFPRSRCPQLVLFSLVCEAWKDIAYPLLYSYVDVQRPPRARVVNFVETLRASPLLGRFVVCLRTYEWSASDFPLLPNLRYFECDNLVTCDRESPGSEVVRPKLEMMVVNNKLSSPDNEEVETFEKWINPEELRSLSVTVFHPYEQSLSPLLVFPTLPLLSLTSFSTTQDSTLLFELDDPYLHLQPLIRRVGPQLLHLSISEEAEICDCSIPSWFFDLCPNLLRFSVTGQIAVGDLVDAGHATLEELYVGGWGSESGGGEENEEEFIEFREIDKNQAEWFCSGGVRFPKMKTMRLGDASFRTEEERRDEELVEVCGDALRLGWVVKDQFGTRWDRSRGDDRGEEDEVR